MWCTAMDTFCTMWKRSPATVMVLPPLWGQQAPSAQLQPQRARPTWGLGAGSHLTGLRRGLMAVMTGFCMYQKVRLPRTQPRCSKRTHTGTGAGSAPPGTVQAMLVSVRLWEGSRHDQQGPHLSLLAPLSPRGTGLCTRPGFKAFSIVLHLVFCPLVRKSVVSVFPLPHFAGAVLPTANTPSL